MIRTICVIAVFLGLVSESFSQMGKIDTKHVSDRSFCVVRIDIERIKSQLKKSKSDSKGCTMDQHILIGHVMGHVIEQKFNYYSGFLIKCLS